MVLLFHPQRAHACEQSPFLFSQQQRAGFLFRTFSAGKNTSGRISPPLARPHQLRRKATRGDGEAGDREGHRQPFAGRFACPVRGQAGSAGQGVVWAAQPADAERVWQQLLESNPPGSTSDNWKDLSSLNIPASAGFGSVAGSWSLQRGAQGLGFKTEIAEMLRLLRQLL